MRIHEGPALHGVLVTYRRPDALTTSLETVTRQERRLDTLVVVDNDPLESARGLVESLGRVSPRPTYVPAGRNLGPAGGIALGMRQVLARAQDDDWVVLLDDDDPPLTTDALRLLAELGTTLRDEDPRTAAVGASGTNFDVARARALRIPDSALQGAVPSSCIGGNQLPLYSVHAIRAVGVFDERLFFGFEELDYGLRLWASGFTVYAHGDVWLRSRRHHGRIGMTTAPQRTLTEPTWRRYYSLRNLIVILRKRGHHLAALGLVARSIAKPVSNLPRTPSLAVRHLRLNGRAIADAYLGRMGLTVPPQPKS
jgi:glycosyltransferase involved in cell wall biosynthesis